MSSFGSSQKPLLSKPPDKGSFPLDREGECKKVIISYLECLTKTGSKSLHCRELAKDYLACRMDKDLMVKEDWNNLGFNENNSEKQ